MRDDGLRSWLKEAADLGELRTIEGADWDLEIGGVADIVTERGSSPAVLFDSIKNYFDLFDYDIGLLTKAFQATQ